MSASSRFRHLIQGVGCVVFCGVSAPGSFGQTLTGVLRAVQERQIFVEQSSLVANESGSYPLLIEWGFNLAPMPSEQSVEGLTFTQKIRLLQIASGHYSRLRYAYYNVDTPTGPAVSLSPTPAMFDKFTPDDLPDLPVVNAANYVTCLRSLAGYIRKLRVLAWPATAPSVRNYAHDLIATPGSPPPVAIPLKANATFGPTSIPIGDFEGLFTSPELLITGDSPVRKLVAFGYSVGEGMLIDSWTEAGQTLSHLYGSNGYAIGLRIKWRPEQQVNSAGTISWHGVALKAWFADDWSPRNPNVATRGWRSVDLTGGTLAGNEITFGTLTQSTGQPYPTPWELSQLLGLPLPFTSQPPGPPATLAGQWTTPGHSLFDPALPSFSYERRLILFASGIFSDSDLGVQDQRWHGAGTGAGDLDVRLTHPLLELDLGLGVGPGASAGKLIAGGNEASFGFDGLKFAGSRSEFSFVYELPPTVIVANDASAQQAGWDFYQTYRSAATRLRIKEVRGSQIVAKFSRTGDYNCTIDVHALSGSAVGPLIRKVKIYNPSAAAGAFPTERGHVIIEETDGSTNGRKWDVLVSFNTAGYPASVIMNLSSATSSQVDDETGYTSIPHMRDESVGSLGCYRYLNRRRDAGGTLRTISDADVRLGNWPLADRDVYLKRLVEAPVNDTTAPLRMTNVTSVEFPSAVAQTTGWEWFVPIIKQYVPQTITTNGAGWALHQAEWRFGSTGELDSAKRSFNASGDFVSSFSADATGYIRTRLDTVNGSQFRVHRRVYHSSLSSHQDFLAPSLSGPEVLVRSVYIAAGNTTAVGELPWMPKSFVYADGAEEAFGYLSDVNKLTEMRYSGPPGLAKGVAEVISVNTKGSITSHKVLNAGPFNRSTIPFETNGGVSVVLWKMTATGTPNALGQPSQYTFADGSKNTLTRIPAGSFAGAIKRVVGRDNRAVTRTLNVEGETSSATEAGGPTWAVAGDPLSRVLTFSGAGTMRSVTAAQNAFGDMLDFQSNFGLGHRFQRTGTGSANLTFDSAVGAGRTVGATFAADGSSSSVAPGAGGVGGTISRSAVSLDNQLRIKLTETFAGANGPTIVSYYDYRGRLVRRETSPPSGSGSATITTYSYPTERSLVIQTLTSAHPGRVLSLSADFETIETYDNNAAQTNKWKILRQYNGNALVETTSVWDDSSSSPGWIEVSQNRTMPATNQWSTRPFANASLISTGILQYPTNPQDTRVSTTLTGPYDQSQVKTLAGQPVEAWMIEGGESMSTDSWILDGLRQVTSRTSTRPGFAESFVTQFDGAGRVASVDGPGWDSDATLSHSYPSGGRRIVATRPNIAPTILAENAEGYVSEVGAYGGDDATLTTNHAGANTTTSLTPSGAAVINYSSGPWGHLLSRQFVAGGTGYTASWNPDGSPSNFTVPHPLGGSATATAAYSNFGRSCLWAWTDGYGVGVEDYAVGLRKSVSDPVDSSRFTWDHFRLKREDHTAGSAGLAGYSIERKYDSRHRYTGTRVKQGSTVLNETTFGYDAYNRVETLNGGSGGLTGTYGYFGGTGVVDSLVRGALVATLTPESGRLRLGTISTSSSAGAYNTTYKYYPNGLVETQDNSYQPDITYSYDADGRLESASDGSPPPPNGPSPLAFSGTWSPPGNPTNGGFAAANALNQLTSRSNAQTCMIAGQAVPGSTVRLWKQASFYPDPAAAITLTVSPSGTFYTQWDPGAWNGWRRIHTVVEGKLTGGGDGGSNRVSIARYTVIVPPANNTFTHDAAGNRSSDSKHTYSWDPRGRMTSLARTSGFAAVAGGTMGTSFVFDPQGRRIKKTVTEPGRTTVTKWLYDGWQPVMEETTVNGGPAKRKFFMWGLDLSQSMGGAGGIGGLLAVRDASTNKTYYPVSDGRGNIIALVDAEPSSHPTVARWTYDAWGNTASSSGDTSLCPFGWQSKYRDPETGLIYFGYRTYDPSTRRWLSRDPLGEAGSTNLYSYCHEDPINRIDPSGKASILLEDAMLSTISMSEYSPEPSAADVLGVRGLSALAVPFALGDPGAVMEQLFTARLSGVASFDFSAAAIDSGVASILDRFMANLARPKYHLTTWFDKPWTTEYDDAASKCRALCELSTFMAPHFTDASGHAAFRESAANSLNWLARIAPRDVDPNTWSFSASEMVDPVVQVGLVFATEGLSAQATLASRGTIFGSAGRIAAKTTQMEFGFVQAVERQTIARDFYRATTGMNDSKIASHLRGIDFSQPVSVVNIPAGTSLIQFNLSGRVGNYFAPVGTPSNTLGIYTSGLKETSHTFGASTRALRSTAASVIDDWSMSGAGWRIQTGGGGTQYFAPR